MKKYDRNQLELKRCYFFYCQLTLKGHIIYDRNAYKTIEAICIEV